MAAAIPAHGQAYRPAFHPETLKAPPDRQPNEVLVLGTSHLSGLPPTFQPEMLAPLLDRLAAWRPTQIAIESVSGLQCDSMRRYPSRYADTVNIYCPDPTAAARATGLDVSAANAEAERLLATWPATPSAAQRRHLAAVFLAAGERHSALVQWLRLPMEARHAGDGLTDGLAADLGKLAVRRNENSLIAAVLAARIGLERVWSVDDHTADSADSSDPAERKAAGEAIGGAWKNPDSAARRAADDRLVQGLTTPGGLMDLYRWNNRPEAAMQAYRADFGAVLREPSPQQFGRGYVTYWETRNLRMVANIREVLGNSPGGRLLAIVGASHKGYYEAYLNMMHDATLVDAEVVLK
jgi:hypothetical protein